MGPHRKTACIVATICFATLLAVRPAPADELGAAGGARALTIHAADETLRDFCARDAQDRLWLELPGGARYELVTSVEDPAIANQGDGAFHAFSIDEVRAALANVRFPLASVRADIFILPYPRRNGLESAAGPELILLSPGVRPLSREQQHAELTHELGHIVQYALMPDLDGSLWGRYRNLRGIANAAVYAGSSPHADRPHEIFAEDFRALFGDPLATYSGSIENAHIVEPAQVAGLAEFMLALAGGGHEATLAAYPNPSRGALRFGARGVSLTPLDVFDAQGRVVATVEPQGGASGVEWRWDGHDRLGRPATRGVLFARVRGTHAPAMRVTLIP